MEQEGFNQYPKRLAAIAHAHGTPHRRGGKQRQACVESFRKQVQTSEPGILIEESGGSSRRHACEGVYVSFIAREACPSAVDVWKGHQKR